MVGVVGVCVCVCVSAAFGVKGLRYSPSNSQMLAYGEELLDTMARMLPRKFTVLPSGLCPGNSQFKWPFLCNTYTSQSRGENVSTQDRVCRRYGVDEKM